MAALYAVAVRADRRFDDTPVIQSGALVASDDDEALRLARQATARNYPHRLYNNVVLHVSRIPAEQVQLMVEAGVRLQH